MNKIKKMRKMDAKNKMQRIEAVGKLCQLLNILCIDKKRKNDLANTLGIDEEDLEMLVESLQKVSILELKPIKNNGVQ